MNARIIYSIFATKYNYKNSKPRHTIVSIRDNKLFYRSRNNKLKEMIGIIGIVYGTRTYTWSNKELWENHNINSSLCISAISPNRTYDFEFDCLDSILAFLNITNNIKSTFTGISGEFINKHYHKYTDEYITYYHNLFTSCNYPNINVWNSFLKEYKWDTEKNAPLIDQSIQKYKNISNNVKGLTTNHTCCICLDEWNDSDMCKILQCNHILHTDCFECFPSERTLKCPCCRATVDNI